jgi:hypothetical protein
MLTKVDKETFAKLEQDSKIALLATTDPQGYPHLTFLSSLQAKGEDQMTFGQFCQGLSKEFIRSRPEVSFLVMNADMEMWRGRARFTHTANSGEDFDLYNNKPLFRYNSYLGFNTIYYMDLVGITPMEKLNLAKIGIGAVLSRIAKPCAAKSDNKALTYIGRKLCGDFTGLKFLAYQGEDGWHRIIPIVQGTNAGSDRILFSTTPYRNEIKAIPAGTKTAVLALNLKMQSVLVKGTFTGIKGIIPTGTVEIERVYNSMPPKAQYIWPTDNKIHEVVEF